MEDKFSTILTFFSFVPAGFVQVVRTIYKILFYVFLSSVSIT